MKEKKEKSLIPIAGITGVITLFIVLIAGNLIIIGDKIANINIYLSYLFYSVIGVLLIWLILIPVIRIMTTPALTGIRAKDIARLTPKQTSEYIMDLKRSMKLSSEEVKLLQGGDRKKAIEKIVNRRIEEMEQVIKESAVSNFAITAISQNGSLDFFSSMVINFRMISGIINKLGRRPSYMQLFKLYVSVLSASLLITTLDDILNDVDYGELLGGIGEVGGQALNIIVPSATNGLMNAFVTLRVGYATIKYLEVGNESFDKAEARKFAMKSARKRILGVGKDGVVEIFKKSKQMLGNINDI